MTKHSNTLAAAAAVALGPTLAAGATPADQAAIATRVEAVAALVDIHAFDPLEALFSETLQVGYPSLFGGEIETLAASELMSRWAGLAPGFDRTRHAIRGIRVDIEGDRASAGAAVVGTHWLDGESWVVAGRYAYEFERQAGEWRITSMTLIATEETGDRALVERAAARAAG